MLFTAAIVSPPHPTASRRSAAPARHYLFVMPSPSPIEVVKPSGDKREYRHVTLSNSLRCILISDPLTEKMAASMNVLVGYCCDPDGLEGNSRLLHHSIFHGNEYEDFKEFILQNGGSTKLETICERTSFSFHMDCNILSDAISRFAHFFVNPAVTPQVSASEKFYQSFYSADRMSLVIYGKAVVFVENLNELEELVARNFSSIRNVSLETLVFPGQPSETGFLQILMKAVPFNGGHSMRMQWPLAHGIQNSEVFGSCKYLGFLFSYEGEGSLSHALKAKGWSQQVNHSEFSFFSVDIELTDCGQRHFGSICALIFKYIKMLRKSGPRKYIFEKVKRLLEESRNCQVDETLINYVDKIASNLLVFPPKNCLLGATFPHLFSGDSIKKILNALTENNVRLFWLSKEFEGQTSMKFNGILYSVEPITSFVIQKWRQDASEIILHLPSQAALQTVGQNDNAPKVTLRLPSQAEFISDAPLIGVDQKASAHGHSQRIDSVKNENKQGECNVCIVYDERMLNHIPPRSHKVEVPGRIKAIREKLQNDGLLERCTCYGSERARLKDVLEVHEDDYVLRILGKQELSKEEKTKGDMYISKGSRDAILLAAGCAIKASHLVSTGKHQHAFALVRPPGHHAKRALASGFCFINNAAVATKSLTNEGKKVLILDWDVHFGDRTAEIFYDDNNALFISLHRYPFDFPEPNSGKSGSVGSGAGEGFTCNIPLVDSKVKDHDLYAIFDHIVMPLAGEFNPDIVLISGGFDAAKNDLLGDCKLTPKGYATALHKLLKLQKGVVIVLEGGYNWQVTADCCSACIKILCGDMDFVEFDVEYYPLESTWDAILETQKFLKKYWNCFKSPIPDQILARTKPKYPKPKK